MDKLEAQQCYKRMAEIVKELGSTDARQVTGAIAKASKVSFEAASKWKDGRTKWVTLPRIRHFCQSTGASQHFIATGSGPKYRNESSSALAEEALQLFQLLNEDGQEILLAQLRAVVDRQRSKNSGES